MESKCIWDIYSAADGNLCALLRAWNRGQRKLYSGGAHRHHVVYCNRFPAVANKKAPVCSICWSIYPFIHECQNLWPWPMIIKCYSTICLNIPFFICCWFFLSRAGFNHRTHILPHLTSKTDHMTLSSNRPTRATTSSPDTITWESLRVTPSSWYPPEQICQLTFFSVRLWAALKGTKTKQGLSVLVDEVEVLTTILDKHTAVTW